MFIIRRKRYILVFTLFLLFYIIYNKLKWLQIEEIVLGRMESNCIQVEGPWIYTRNNYVLFNGSFGDFSCFYMIILEGDFHPFIENVWFALINNTYLWNHKLRVRCKGTGIFNFRKYYIHGFDDMKKVRKKRKKVPDILFILIHTYSTKYVDWFLSNSMHFIRHEMRETSVLFRNVEVLDIMKSNYFLNLSFNLNEIDRELQIWKKLGEYNVTTYFDEDSQNSSFLFSKVKANRVDFYPTILQEKINLRKNQNLCVNEKSIFKHQLESVNDFFNVVNIPKFAFLFSTYFDNVNINEGMVEDNELLGFLKEIINPKGRFNNTFFILMTSLFTKEKDTMLFVNFPYSMMKKSSKPFANLKQLRNSMITSVEVYETILSIVNNINISVKEV